MDTATANFCAVTGVKCVPEGTPPPDAQWIDAPWVGYIWEGPQYFTREFCGFLEGPSERLASLEDELCLYFIFNFLLPRVC